MLRYDSGRLFKGISPTLIRSVPAAASTFLVFEVTKGGSGRPSASARLGYAEPDSPLLPAAFIEEHQLV